MQLKQIQPTIQQVVVAIAAALKIEVEVADQQLFRVAGTGVIKSNVWKEMRNEDYVYRKCIETGKPVIIENPGANEICRPCIHYGNCAEVGEVCCPIVFEGKPIGVIGLLAFGQHQRDKLFSDLQANLDFLEKMAELIVSKMIAYQYHHEQMLIKQKISTLIHHMDSGIIMIDRFGECDFINPAAQRLLHLSSEEKPYRAILDQLLELFHNHKLGTAHEPSAMVTMQLREDYKQFYVTVHLLGKHADHRDAVIILEDPEYIKSVASRLSEGDDGSNFDQIIGNHASIRTLKDFMRKVANGRSPLLIVGENGTGKEWIGKAIHQHSDRRNKPFVSLNCGAHPEAVLAYELFGYSLSAENGKQEKKCKLEIANGGTLFLDDIADLPMSIQIKLLHVLEEKKLESPHSNEPVFLDIRFIAATDKDLELLVSKGLFRKDLYYKLNVIPLHVPPLRERKEDILPLAYHFLEQHGKSNGKNIQFMNEDFKKVLTAHHWPGNIRELSNVIEYAVNVENGKSLSRQSLPAHLRNLEIVDAPPISNTLLNLRHVEKETIRQAILTVKERGEPKEKAAELLGIGRATLFRKLQEYQL